MHASIGDQILMHSRSVGTEARHAKIIEVRGKDGSPPYFVRFDDGHESLIYPGPDCVVEPKTKAKNKAKAKSPRG